MTAQLPQCRFRRQGHDGATEFSRTASSKAGSFLDNQTVRAGILTTTIVCTLMFPFTTLLPVFARDPQRGRGRQGLLLAAMALAPVERAHRAGGPPAHAREGMIDSSICTA